MGRQLSRPARSGSLQQKQAPHRGMRREAKSVGVACASLKRVPFELLPPSCQDDILRRAVAFHQGKNWKKIGAPCRLRGSPCGSEGCPPAGIVDQPRLRVEDTARAGGSA